MIVPESGRIIPIMRTSQAAATGPRQDLLGNREGQTVADRELLRDSIDGVTVEALKPVVTGNSVTTEILSAYWGDRAPARHAIAVTFRPEAVAAWHMHRARNDYIYVHQGHVLVAMYDGRADSPTAGKVQLAHLNGKVPMLVRIPPGVWHGIQNLLPAGESAMINYFDEPYDSAEPDSWRLPADSAEIPYRFS